MKTSICIDSSKIGFCSSVSVFRNGTRETIVVDAPGRWKSGDEKTIIHGVGNGKIAWSENVVDGIRVRREIFTPPVSGRDTSSPGCCSGPSVAVRLVIENRSDALVELEELVPMSVGPGELNVDDTPFDRLVCVRQPRMKNDMPAAIRLNDRSDAVLDAVRGLPETGGMPVGEKTEGFVPDRFVSSELTMLCGERASLGFGFFPLGDQLVRSELVLNQARSDLASLEFSCLCDRQVLEPGKTVCGQWLGVFSATDPVDVAAAYSATLKACYGTRNRGCAPTVWCSWYYYGDGFTSREFEENMRYLEGNPLPIDVVLIDECWDTRWGDWEPNRRWPDMKRIASRISAAGYTPGLWTCAFLAEPRSTMRYHHDHWLLRDRDGNHIRFSMNSSNNYVLDPTHPEVLAFLEDLYRRLTNEWGFTYHKIDFMRAVAHPDAVFHDRTMNRAQAYRTGLEAIRLGIGDQSYLNVCGGLYGPTFGLAEAQRTGSDVKSLWPEPPGGMDDPYGPFTIKQNTLRFWIGGVCDTDPDALMVRRRKEAHRGEVLSLGLMNDAEAETSALNQFLGGRLVCFSENLSEVDEDRFLLLSRCSPSIGSPAIPRDILEGSRFPSVFDTHVVANVEGLQDWHIVSCVNWKAREDVFRFVMDRRMLGKYAGEDTEFVVSNYHSGEYRVVKSGEDFETGPVQPHGCGVFKIQRLVPGVPFLLGTDGHFSMGGVEVREWNVFPDRLDVVVDWPWRRPLNLAVASPVPGKAPADFRVCRHEIPAAVTDYRAVIRI